MVERIGRGGMASVYRAHDPDLNRHVAVKVPPSFQTEDPTFVERFRQEAQAVARLNHPNIVQIYDVGEDKGFIYIVMEHVNGGTLHDRLGDRLPLAEVL
jgi:serine/threonine-protein kinase